MSCWNGFEGRCSSFPILSLSSPFDSYNKHVREAERRESKTSWEEQRTGESLSVEEWGLSMRQSMSTYIFSVQFSAQFKSAQPCISGWTPLGKGSCPADEIRKGRVTPLTTPTFCETPMTTPHFFSPHSQQELSLLLVHTIPSIAFVTANNKGKIIVSDLEHCGSKIKFCPLSLEIWSSSARNKAYGNHVCISFHLEGAV